MIVHKFYFNKDIEALRTYLETYIDKPSFGLSTRDDIFAGKVKGNRVWIVKTNKFPESFFSRVILKSDKIDKDVINC